MREGTLMINAINVEGFTVLSIEARQLFKLPTSPEGSSIQHKKKQTHPNEGMDQFFRFPP